MLVPGTTAGTTAGTGGGGPVVGGLAPGPVKLASATAGAIIGPPLADLGASVGGLGATIGDIAAGTPVLGVVARPLSSIAGEIGHTLTTTGELANIQMIGLSALPLVGPTVGSLGALDTSFNALLGLTVGNRLVSGPAGAGSLLNASVLAPGVAVGAPLNVSVLSGGKVLAVGNLAIGAPGAAQSPPPATAGLVGGVLHAVTGLTGGLLGQAVSH